MKNAQERAEGSPSAARRASSAAALAAVMSLASCEGFYRPAEELIMNDNMVVLAMAQPGALAGGIAGLPIGLTAAFVAGPFGIDPGPATSEGLILAPAAFLAQAGAIATAGIPWLVVTVFEGEGSCAVDAQ